jgi:hypothetical protein
MCPRTLRSVGSLSIALVVIGALALSAAADEKGKRKLFAPPSGPKEVERANRTLSTPNWGYSYGSGAWEVRMPTGPTDTPMGVYRSLRYSTGDIVFVHSKLTYVGTGFLFGRNGWIFQTEFDGTDHASKLFFSDERETPDDYAFRYWHYRNAEGWQGGDLCVRTPPGP